MKRGGRLNRQQVHEVILEPRRPGVIKALATKYRCSEALISHVRRQKWLLQL